MEVPSSPVTTAGDSPSSESKAQEQARLRRERRNAKIQAGGSARLSKINSLSGRPLAAEAELLQSQSPRAQQPSQRTSSGQHPGDPEEVDITRMFQRPQTDPSLQNPQDMFRQMLAGMGPPPGLDPSPQAGEPDADDPMVRMMQQLLGAAGAGGDGDSALPAGLPAGLASMFGGQQQPEPQTNVNNIWRIIHAAFSLLLGLYVAFTFTFTGSELGRLKHPGSSVVPQLFWIFATAELVLQSSRYFIDGGKLPISGILGGLGQMLPEPYAHYVRLFSRYSIIYTTIVSDAMVIIFVLGLVAWWKGLAAA